MENKNITYNFKSIIILLIMFFIFIGGKAQVSQNIESIVIKVDSLIGKNESSKARDYLLSNKHLFDEKEENQGIFSVMWGIATCNIILEGNTNHSIIEEYKEYFKSFVKPALKTNLDINENTIPILYILLRTYSQICIANEEHEEAHKYLKMIVEMYKDYPLLKDSNNYARVLWEYCQVSIKDLHLYGEISKFVDENLTLSEKYFGDKSMEYGVSLFNKYICEKKINKTNNLLLLENSQNILNSIEEFDDEVLNKIDYILKIERGEILNNNIEHKDVYTLEECSDLIMAENSIEAIPSLLYMINTIDINNKESRSEFVNVAKLLCSAYIQQGNIVEVQQVLDKWYHSVEINKMSDYEQLNYYNLKGIVAYELCKYNESLLYFEETLNIYEDNKEKLPAYYYPTFLSDIADCYSKLKEVELAKLYIDKAVNYFKQNVSYLSGYGQTQAGILLKQAHIYTQSGDREKAKSIYLNVINTKENKDNAIESVNLAKNDLADIYIRENNIEESIKYLESIKTEDLNCKRAVYSNLLIAYYLSDNKKLYETLLAYNNIIYSNFIDIISCFSHEEEDFYLSWYMEQLLFSNNLIASKHSSATGIAYNNLLLIKNFNLKFQETIKKIIYNSQNDSLIQSYNNLVKYKHKIIYDSENEDSILFYKGLLLNEEKYLINNINLFEQKIINDIGTWEEVQKQLSNNEVAIEFTLIPKRINSDRTEWSYGAFILRNNNNPILIELCNKTEIDNYLRNYYLDPIDINNLYFGDSINIYYKIWQNIEPYLENINNIYFSLIGELNAINHFAIKDNEGNLMGNKYNLYRVSSTNYIKEIKSRKSNIADFSSIVLYGGVNYDASTEDMVYESYMNKMSNRMISNLRTEARGRWGYLEGTKNEAEIINELFQNHNIETKLYIGNEANEESFINLSNDSPSIIHLATHGYFIQSDKEYFTHPFTSKLKGFNDREYLLTSSGLLLAGANNIWTGKVNNLKITEDGILTADEISDLNLGNTNLVILSACETAKGVVDNIEGIYGLQRGFKKAGVQTIIMSLWKVDDEATALMMTTFYKELLRTGSKHDAFVYAQKVVKEQYDDPYFWASFVMLD